MFISQKIFRLLKAFLFFCLSEFYEEPNKVLLKDHKTHKLLVASPLVLANGNTKVLKKTAEVSTPGQKGVPLISEPNGSPSSSHHPPSAEKAAQSAPTKPKPIADQSDEQADLPPSFIPEPPVKTNTSHDSKAKDSQPKTQLDPKPDQERPSVGSAIVMDLIPPPSDFMDEPAPQTAVPAQPAEQNQGQTSQSQVHTQEQPQPRAQHKEQSQPQHPPQPALQLQVQPPPQSIMDAPLESTTIAPPPGFDEQNEVNKPQCPVTLSTRGPLSPSDLEKLRKKASLKKKPGLAPLDKKVSSDSSSFPCTDGHPGTLVEHSDPKSPPLVAPKPKKFPSNINLKSHKDSGPNHSLVSSGERLMNQEQVHREALKKLGLLKAGETNSGHLLGSSPPQRIPSPHPFNTSTAEDAAQAQPAHTDQHAAEEAQGKVPLNSGKAGRESPKPENRTVSMEAPSASLKGVPAEQSCIATGQEKRPEKTVELSPGQLRRNRPRPASAGSQKDLGIDPLPSVSSREPEVRRSLGSSPVRPSTQSSTASRSHGMISVVFMPNSKNGDDRKQALKKLGLIRD